MTIIKVSDPFRLLWKFERGNSAGQNGLSGFLIRKDEETSAPESILIRNVISGSIENASPAIFKCQQLRRNLFTILIDFARARLVSEVQKNNYCVTC